MEDHNSLDMSNDHTILVSRSVDMTLLDEELRVAADVQCDRCGYNLRTLSVDARCPECNKPVEASLREPLLAHASASHLRILHAGAWLIWVGSPTIGISASGSVFRIPTVAGRVDRRNLMAPSMMVTAPMGWSSWVV